MQWVLDHLHFTPKFEKGKFTTVTGGVLRSTEEGQEVWFIVEVKRRMRYKRR